MRGIYYENTHTNIPGWDPSMHESVPYGYAYETDSHFVHFYGNSCDFNLIAVGLTAIQGKNGTLLDWVQSVFGATNIQPLRNEIGHVIEGIWRPSLRFRGDIQTALKVDSFDRQSSGQALRNLITKLDELFLYIEPSSHGLQAYGHKCRELLILACTEVENHWVSLIKRSNLQNSSGRYVTRDYVRLLNPCLLKEYKISYKNHFGLRDFNPFTGWDSANPTISLTWYDAYNKTKHDRNTSFNYATLENVLDAIAACIVMYCVKYGPYDLTSDNTLLSGAINEHFTISFEGSDRSSYYIPQLTHPVNTRKDLLIYDSYREKHNDIWVTDPLVL
ncbi:TPA: hypothetical protein N5K71_003097 [Enterobacter hormaechei subsp. steigerwaltii]|nr:hypothetical protein [Enterobacter hormaechei subsp. steigerwaltii]